MAEFYGDLLIGGATIKRVHGELQHDEALPDTHDHLLSGRLSLTPGQNEQLQCGRRYRLQLEDGRAGLVVVSRIENQRPDEYIVEFEPLSLIAQAR